MFPVEFLPGADIQAKKIRMEGKVSIFNAKMQEKWGVRLREWARAWSCAEGGHRREALAAGRGRTRRLTVREQRKASWKAGRPECFCENEKMAALIWEN